MSLVLILIKHTIHAFTVNIEKLSKVRFLSPNFSGNKTAVTVDFEHLNGNLITDIELKPVLNYKQTALSGDERWLPSPKASELLGFSPDVKLSVLLDASAHHDCEDSLLGATGMDHVFLASSDKDFIFDWGHLETFSFSVRRRNLLPGNGLSETGLLKFSNYDRICYHCH